MLKRWTHPLLTLALLASSGLAAEKTTDPAKLGEMLAALDLPTRREASLALAHLGKDAKPALAALIKALDDTDKQVWTNSVGAIAAIGPDAAEAVPRLLKDLNSRGGSGQRSYYRDQTIVRTSYALTRIGPAAIPALIEGLHGQDTMLRTGCARALAGMGAAAADAVPALIENLGHGDTGVQREAVEALGAIGPAAKPKLVEALGWNQPAQRANAALALGAMGKAAQDAAPAMLARLKEEKEASVRGAFLSALPRVGADAGQLVPALIAGLKDDREEIRHSATNSLLTMRSAQPQIVKALTGMLQEGNPEFTRRAAYVLGRLGEAAAPAVPAILGALSKQSPPDPGLLDALVQIGEPAVTPMLVHFEKADPATISRDHWVIKCLQQMGGVAAAPVGHDLTHPSASVRLLAARSLAELGADAEPAVPALMKALDDSDVRVQGAALMALSSTKAPIEHLTPRIDTAFKSKSPVLRAAAVEAAVRLGAEAKELRPQVIAALKDPDESVRKAVINHLGENFGDAVAELTPMLDDPSRRSGVIDALGRIGPASKPAVPKLQKLMSTSAKDEKLRIVAALGHIGPAAIEAVPALDQLRQDKDAAVRMAAIQAEVAIQTQTAPRVAALVAGLDDPDREVRRAVAEIIKGLGDRAVDTSAKLIALADNDGDREFALAALSQINMRDVPKLVELLHHTQPSVQLFACRRLENLGRKAKEAVPALEELSSSSDQELARAARHAVRLISVK